MDVYIGLDVSLASTAICAMSAQGTIVKETTDASEPEDLVASLKAVPGNIIAVGLEAGPQSQWLYQHLTDAGFSTVLMETRHVKGTLKAMPIKTDRRDAEGIARLLQMGWYRVVHCKSVSSQDDARHSVGAQGCPTGGDKSRTIDPRRAPELWAEAGTCCEELF